MFKLVIIAMIIFYGMKDMQTTTLKLVRQLGLKK